MIEDQPEAVLKAAASVAGAGGLARVVIALSGGERSWVVLTIHAAVGCVLGVIAAGILIYVDPSTRGPGWPEIIRAGFAGLAGALGTKSLDMLAEAAKRRLGL